MKETQHVEINTKYRILINYLKELIKKDTYINIEEINKILKVLEEVE